MTATQTEQSAVRYDRDADGIVTLTLDDPTASANTMNELYLESMAAAVQRLYDEVDDVTGVVFAMGEAVKAGLRKLEVYPRPVVAAINGAALGGGFEICLACNHRVAVDDG